MANRFTDPIREAETPVETETAAVHVKEIAEGEFEAEVLGAPMPVVLDFYSADSKSCEALAPRFAAVAQKFAGKVRFFRVLHGRGELSAKLGVSASPTLVFFKSGKEAAERLTGDDVKRTALKARVEVLLA